MADDFDDKENQASWYLQPQQTAQACLMEEIDELAELMIRGDPNIDPELLDAYGEVFEYSEENVPLMLNNIQGQGQPEGAPIADEYQASCSVDPILPPMGKDPTKSNNDTGEEIPGPSVEKLNVCSTYKQNRTHDVLDGLAEEQHILDADEQQIHTHTMCSMCGDMGKILKEVETTGLDCTDSNKYKEQLQNLSKDASKTVQPTHEDVNLTKGDGESIPMNVTIPDTQEGKNEKDQAVQWQNIALPGAEIDIDMIAETIEISDTEKDQAVQRQNIALPEAEIDIDMIAETIEISDTEKDQAVQRQNIALPEAEIDIDMIAETIEISDTEKDQAVQRQNIALPEAEIDIDMIAETIEISDTDDSDENPENLPVQETQDLLEEEVDTISLDTTLSYEDTNEDDEEAQTDTSMGNDSADVQTISEDTLDLNTDLQFDSPLIDLEKENLQLETDKSIQIDSEMITEKDDFHFEAYQKPKPWTERSLSLASDINLSGEDLESVYNHESGDLAAEVRFKNPVRVQINSDDEFELFQGTLLTGWKADFTMDVDISEVIDDHISEDASGNNDLKPPQDHKLKPEDGKIPRKNENQEPSSTGIDLSVGTDQEPLLDLNLSTEDFINEVLAFDNVMDDDEDQVSVVLETLDLSMNEVTVSRDKDEKINFDSSLNDLNLSPEGLTNRSVTPEAINGKDEGLEAFYDHDYAALSAQLQSTSPVNAQITSKDLSPTLIEKEHPEGLTDKTVTPEAVNGKDEDLEAFYDHDYAALSAQLQSTSPVNAQITSKDLNPTLVEKENPEGLTDRTVTPEAVNGKDEGLEAFYHHDCAALSAQLQSTSPVNAQITSKDLDPTLIEKENPADTNLTLQDVSEKNIDQEPLPLNKDNLLMDIDAFLEDQDEKMNLKSSSDDLNLSAEGVRGKGEKNDDPELLSNHESVATSSKDDDPDLVEKARLENADLTLQDARAGNKEQESLLATIDLPMDVDIISEGEDEKINLGSSSVDLNLPAEAMADKDVTPQAVNEKNEELESESPVARSANTQLTSEELDSNLEKKEGSVNADLTLQDASEGNKDQEPLLATIDLPMDVDIISEGEDEKINNGSFSVDLNLPAEAMADKNIMPKAGNEQNEELESISNHESAVARSANTQLTSKELDSNLKAEEGSVNADEGNKDQEPLLATIDLPMGVDIILEEKDEKINLGSSSVDSNLSTEAMADKDITPKAGNEQNEELESISNHESAVARSANTQFTSEDFDSNVVEKEGSVNADLTLQDASEGNKDQEPFLATINLPMGVDIISEGEDEKINNGSFSVDLNLPAEAMADKNIMPKAGNEQNEELESISNHESAVARSANTQLTSKELDSNLKAEEGSVNADEGNKDQEPLLTTIDLPMGVDIILEETQLTSEELDSNLEEIEGSVNADLTLQDASEGNKDQEPLLATIDLPMDVDIISEGEDEKINLGSSSVDSNLSTGAIADEHVTPQTGNEKNEDLEPLPNHELAVASSSNTQFTSDLDSNLEEKERSVNVDLTSQDASGENKDQEPLLLATIDLPMDVDIIPEEEDEKANLGSSVDFNLSAEALANKNVPESGNGKNEDNCESAIIANAQNTLEDVDLNLTGKGSSLYVDLTSQDAVEENEQIESQPSHDLSMDTASSADLSKNTTSTDLKSSSEEFFQGMISEETSSADPRSSSSEDLPPVNTHQDLKRAHDDVPQEVSSADPKSSSAEDMPQTDAQDLELLDDVDPLEIHLAEIRATDFGSIQVQPNKAPKHDSKGPCRKLAKVSSPNMDQVAIQNQVQDDGIRKGQEKRKPDDHFVCVPVNQESTSKDFSDQGASEGLSIIPDFDKSLPVIRLRDQSELFHTDFKFFKFERKCKKCGKSIEGNETYLSWGSNEFCNEICLLNFQKGIGSECVRCKKKVTAVNLGKYCLRFYSDLRQFCGAECLKEYKKGLNLCALCQNIVPETQDIIISMTEIEKVRQICWECDNRNKQSSSLESGSASRKCSTCAQNKPITITYEHDNQNVPFCSDACFMEYGFVNRTKMDKCSICKKYFDIKILQQYSMYYENLIRVFCSKRCQSSYLISTRKIVPCTWCKATKYNFDMIKCHLQNEVITTCSTSCLSLYQIYQKLHQSPKIKCDYCQQKIKPTYHLTMSDGRMHSFCSRACVKEFQRRFPTVTSREPVTVRPATGSQTSPLILNPVPFVMSSQIKPIIKPKQQYIIKPAPKPMQKNVMTMCSINKHDAEVQMKPINANNCVQTDAVPPNIIAVPVPIYVPMPMFMYSMPYPVPVPFALPIPVPIFIPTTRTQYKTVIKDLQTLPKNPLEAEIVMMAKLIADTGDKETTPECVQPSDIDTKSDNLLSIGWENMEAIDLSCSNLQELAPPEKKKSVNEPKPSTSGTRKRSKRQAKGPPRKQLCRDAKKVAQPTSDELEEKSLKYTHSVSTWTKWIAHKNLDLERIHPYRPPFNPDLLQLTPHELNNLLCTFINEIKKPTGQDYTPDIIYYLCLGIQMYLNINGRKDNIFCDPYYETFVTSLDEIVKIFPDTYSDSNYIVTRVEEEHLWESKQLGAHSPHVLLNTLIFFNTKYFNLKTINNHLQISFATVMKHWKSATKSTGKQPKRVLLRYYPTRDISEGAQVRKIYEQHENVENQLRCPIKLYDFYLSKCPESVKSRADVFYLQPERSCVPESPVWFSVNPMPTHVIAKTLNRVKLVKEINIAFLNDAQS